MDSKIHVKAFMEDLCDEDGYAILDAIRQKIPNNFDDDVFEFDIVIKNVKDVTDEVGVDEDGCRNFSGVEINDVPLGADE